MLFEMPSWTGKNNNQCYSRCLHFEKLTSTTVIINLSVSLCQCIQARRLEINNLSVLAGQLWHLTLFFDFQLPLVIIIDTNLLCLAASQLAVLSSTPGYWLEQ